MAQSSTGPTLQWWWIRFSGASASWSQISKSSQRSASCVAVEVAIDASKIQHCRGIACWRKRIRCSIVSLTSRSSWRPSNETRPCCLRCWHRSRGFSCSIRENRSLSCVKITSCWPRQVKKSKSTLPKTFKTWSSRSITGYGSKHYSEWLRYSEMATSRAIKCSICRTKSSSKVSTGAHSTRTSFSQMKRTRS